MKTASPPQRFQADRFLDMLAKTFDPKVAYADLLAALHQRLNLEPPTSANTTMSVPEAASGSPTTLEAAVNCPEAVPIPGTVVTYTSDPHVRGSRAFYQCMIGYTGKSRFVQCQISGQWSSVEGYTGCTPVDCGIPTPTVQHGTPTVTGTTYGAAVIYTCDPQQGDFRLLGPPSGQGAGGGAQTHNRRVPADHRADLQAPVPPTLRCYSGSCIMSSATEAKISEIEILLLLSRACIPPLDLFSPMHPGGVGTVASESALRSAGTYLSRVRAPSPAPWPDGGPESLRASYCGLAI
ncbi:cnpolydom [Plakobranchus ocellatus]|uniref:Cnpolydom n=1 Tax=Plakobranchus ocellatus TaxID=259542 RepID=A0AAV3ZKW2_9GAST|nr:cnpolydom [Plakobranchus ocellatus]